MSSEILYTKRILVTGTVQGVYYRQSTKAKARELGCTGEVRNLTDGSVEIFCTGTDAQLNALISWCHQGPVRAVVATVEVFETELRLFSGFSIVSSL